MKLEASRAALVRCVSCALSLSLAVSLTLTVGACGPPAGSRPLVGPAAAFVASGGESAPPGMPEENPGGEPFTLRAGDVLRLRTFSLDALELERLMVDASGSVVLPLAGPVRVAGLDLAAASSRVEVALARYDRFVRVQLTLVEPGGHRATVLGTVAHPGVHPLAPETRVADLLALAGGPTAQPSEGESVSLADLAGARVVRAGRALPVSVERAAEGDPLHNVRVQPGDLLYVPATTRQRVSVLGSVRSPRSIPFRQGLRLSDAIAMAGGTSPEANAGDVRVVRGALSRPELYTASLTGLANGEAADAMLRPGDVVFVSEHWLATTSQVLNRLTPLLAVGALAAGLAR